MAFTLNLSLQEIMLGIIIYASKFCGGGKFDVFSIHFYKLLLLPPSHNPRNTNRVFKGFSHLLKFSFRDVNKRNPTFNLDVIQHKTEMTYFGSFLTILKHFAIAIFLVVDEDGILLHHQYVAINRFYKYCKRS